MIPVTYRHEFQLARSRSASGWTAASVSDGDREFAHRLARVSERRKRARLTVRPFGVVTHAGGPLLVQ